MTDEIIRELWEIKDSIAREHEYDVDALVAHLQARERAEGRRTVRKNPKQDARAHTNG